MGDGEGFRGSSKENGVEAMYALSSFPSTTPYAARPNSSRSSFPTPSSVIWLLTTARSQLDIDQKIKKWLIEYLAVVRLKECNAEKEAATTTVTRDETAQLLNKLKLPPY